MNNKEISVIRELCKKYMEIANSERHIRMRKRFRDTNGLKIVRPPLLIEEIPWQQMNFEHALDLVCEDPELRAMEYGLRMELFREKYFKCDNFIEPFLVVKKAFSSTGNGLEIKEKSIKGKDTDIRSHSYEDILQDERALEAFHLPVITAYPEIDKANVAHMQEIVGDTIPVVLQGHGIYYAPWDIIASLRGVDAILMDIYDRPEYLHKIIKLFTDGMNAEMNQMEELNLYDPSVIALHSTPGYMPDDKSRNGEKYGCGDIWFRTMAQMFSTVSPQVHYEFDIAYSKPLAERCAYTYYGCCEPLDDRIDAVKQFNNIRKVGCSPWANVEKTAEQLGKNFVLSRKPNPANVAFNCDPEIIRKEIAETCEACLKYGCPCDIVLKDISTINNRPENLIVWAKTASKVLDEYYGEE